VRIAAPTKMGQRIAITQKIAPFALSERSGLSTTVAPGGGIQESSTLATCFTCGASRRFAATGASATTSVPSSDVLRPGTVAGASTGAADRRPDLAAST